jgi:hypothetical protein
MRRAAHSNARLRLRAEPAQSGALRCLTVAEIERSHEMSIVRISPVIAAKGALGFGVAALIAWLAISSSPSDARYAELRGLVRSGVIGHASEDEAELFGKAVRQSLLSAGITEPVVINGQPIRGQLHFYLTDPASAGFTRCGAGNAVYDADLDVIFVDRGLFSPSELGVVGKALHWEQWAPKRFAFTQTFIALTLLHELGHRTLHRHTRGIFDARGGAAGRNRELEADRFAANMLRDAYIGGRVTSDSRVLAELAQAGVGTDLDPGQRLVASVLYAASQMSVGLLFSRGSYSSLYSDDSHPTFGERVRRIAGVFANLAGTDAVLTDYLGYFQAITARVEGLRSLPFVEVHSDGPLAAARFDDDGLVTITRSWAVYRVAFQKLDQAGAHGIVQPAQLGVIDSLSAEDLPERIWSVSGQGTFVLVNGRVFQIGATAISQRADLAESIKTAGTILDLNGPDPRGIVVLESGNDLSILQDGRVTTLNWRMLISEAKIGKRVSEPKRGNVSLVGQVLHIYVHEQDGAIAGELEVDIERPASPHYMHFYPSDDIDAYGQLVAVVIGASTHHLLIGKTDLNSKVFVWELFGDRRAELRANYTPLLDALAERPYSGQNVPVIVNRVRAAGPRAIIVTLPGDSTIQYDPTRRTLEPVFHPGTSINVDASTNGLVAFSAFNSYKAFVLRVRDAAR